MMPEDDDGSDLELAASEVKLAEGEEEDIFLENVHIPQLEDIFAVIESDVWIDTEDQSKAKMVMDGFRYLLQMEFQKQQPILASFYELEFVNPSLEHGGSFHYTDRIIAKLKETLLKDELSRLREATRRSAFEGIWDQLDEQKDKTEGELKEIRKEVRKLRRSLKREKIKNTIALLAALSPILQPISQATMEHIFPPIQSKVERQLTIDQAPTLIKVNFKYVP